MVRLGGEIYVENSTKLLKLRDCGMVCIVKLFNWLKPKLQNLFTFLGYEDNY